MYQDDRGTIKWKKERDGNDGEEREDGRTKREGRRERKLEAQTDRAREKERQSTGRWGESEKLTCIVLLNLFNLGTFKLFLFKPSSHC